MQINYKRLSSVYSSLHKKERDMNQYAHICSFPKKKWRKYNPETSEMGDLTGVGKKTGVRGGCKRIVEGRGKNDNVKHLHTSHIIVLYSSI